MSVTIEGVEFTPEMLKLIGLAFVRAGGDMAQLVNEQINPDSKDDDTKSDDDEGSVSFIGGLLVINSDLLEFKCKDCNDNWYPTELGHITVTRGENNSCVIGAVEGDEFCSEECKHENCKDKYENCKCGCQ
jgi:hypothetical protein